MKEARITRAPQSFFSFESVRKGTELGSRTWEPNHSWFGHIRSLHIRTKNGSALRIGSQKLLVLSQKLLVFSLKLLVFSKKSLAKVVTTCATLSENSRESHHFCKGFPEKCKGLPAVLSH